MLDDQYTSSGGTKFPIKWAPPEVLNYTRFSSKSDVWAYGVLMWEVFTCGKMPYGRLKNTEVVERVQRGIILERPKACFKEVYEVCYTIHGADFRNEIPWSTYEFLAGDAKMLGPLPGGATILPRSEGSADQRVPGSAQ